MIKLKYFFILITVSTLFSCQVNKEDIDTFSQSTILIPSQTGKNIFLTYYDSTYLKTQMQAPLMQVFDKSIDEPYTLLSKGLNLIFYNKEGKQTTTLKANYGMRYHKSKKMEVKYNVVLVNINNEVLTTEQLIWDEEKKIIYTNAHVKITRAHDVIMGIGLTSNQNFTKYELKNLTGTFSLNE